MSDSTFVVCGLGDMATVMNVLKPDLSVFVYEGVIGTYFRIEV